MAKKNEVDANITEVNTVLKKRGRKSKKELEAAAQLQLQLQTSDNINVMIEDIPNMSVAAHSKDCNIECASVVHPIFSTTNVNYVNYGGEGEGEGEGEGKCEGECEGEGEDDAKPVAKKRGRKPKGGKIIQQATPLTNTVEPKPNVILHLKCSLKDLDAGTGNNVDIQSFDIQNSVHLTFDVIDPDVGNFDQHVLANNEIKTTHHKIIEDELEADDVKINKETDCKEVWKKLKALEHSLHVNNICDKKSACFWCTYDFDNPPVYIPKYFIKDSYQVYGCFCSPECATAHLMEENIDSSAKFERYHLLNHVYSKIYNYDKNIKPAPNPYYMLEKYYGNLSIQEYRSLLRNERLFLIVDKPLTRILPELHEDNDDFIINNKIIPSNAYQIKKKLQKKQTKTNILSERFGLSQ